MLSVSSSSSSTAVRHTAATMKSTTAPEAGMAHAGEAVVALNAGGRATANPAKCTMFRPGILSFKTLRAKSLRW